MKKVEKNYKLLWNLRRKYGRMRKKTGVMFGMLLNVQSEFWGYREKERTKSTKRTRGEGKWNSYQNQNR